MVDILELLESGKVLQLRPTGYSMYPMLVPNRDSVIIIKADTDKLKRGDVVLYRRIGGPLVLHRIWKAPSDGIYLVGDNQVETEGPLNREQVKGILVAFIRKGKRISVKNPLYLVYAKVWLILRPLRRTIGRKLSPIIRRLNSV